MLEGPVFLKQLIKRFLKRSRVRTSVRIAGRVYKVHDIFHGWECLRRESRLWQLLNIKEKNSGLKATTGEDHVNDDDYSNKAKEEYPAGVDSLATSTATATAGEKVLEIIQQSKHKQKKHKPFDSCDEFWRAS